MRRRTVGLAALAVLVTPLTAFAQSGDPLPPLPPPSDAPTTAPSQPAPTTPAPQNPPPDSSQPGVQIAPDTAPENAPPPTVVIVNPPPQQLQPMRGDGMPDDYKPPKHAPKFSLYTGVNLGVIGYGGSFFTNSGGNPETTGNLVKNGLSFEIDAGARLGYRYIPYVMWEHAFLGAGHRFDGTSTNASSDFVGIGFRLLSFDVDNVAFLSDLAVGFRSVNVSNDTENFKMTSIEIGRLGLGAEIRLSTLFTLSPIARISFGQMTDSTGGITYAANQADKQTGVSFAGGQINYSPREYFVFGLGCGAQFDFFGK
jgi:hypothetical protein